MAIKLKKFINDKNRGKLLLAAWMVLPALLGISLFFRNYSSVEYFGVVTFELLRIYERVSLVLFRVSVFFSIILLFATNVYRKKCTEIQSSLSFLNWIKSPVRLACFWECFAERLADCSGVMFA